MKIKFGCAAAALLMAAFYTAEAHALTATGSFQVSLTIQSNCVVQTASNLAFGSTGVLSSTVYTTNTIGVQCTNTTPYNVGLSPGAATGATVTSRAMTSAANATVSYAVYRDSGHTENWGQTVGTDTMSGTGTGAVQTYTAYGSVAAQTTPAAGAYTDQLTVTVTY